MRHSILSCALAAILALAFEPQARGQTPQPSPPAAMIQGVGLSDVTVRYSRPGVKSRAIWGDLVPYGKIWRAGANDKTYFTFEEDVIIDGTRIGPGRYSFYVLPTETEWTLIFNTDWEGHGTDHNEEADILRFTVTPQDAPHEEWLRYGFDNLMPYRADAYLHWEKKKASFELQIAPELPEVDETEKPVLDAVDTLVIGLLSKDAKMIAPVLANEFQSDMGDKEATLATLAQLFEQGMLDDLIFTMDEAEIDMGGETARVEGVLGESTMGTLDLSLELERRDGEWLILR